MKRSGLIPLAIVAIFAALSAAAAPSPPVAARDRAASCTANVMHPIQVHVTALDPVVRGATLRLRVSASSARELRRAEILMVSDGGAPRVGAGSLALGTLTPGRQAEGVFTVSVPRSGSRFYLQFQVVGEGPLGPLTRGACYNILPDGPLESGRVVVNPDGSRVLEVAARRID